MNLRILLLGLIVSVLTLPFQVQAWELDLPHVEERFPDLATRNGLIFEVGRVELGDTMSDHCLKTLRGLGIRGNGMAIKACYKTMGYISKGFYATLNPDRPLKRFADDRDWEIVHRGELFYVLSPKNQPEVVAAALSQGRLSPGQVSLTELLSQFRKLRSQVEENTKVNVRQDEALEEHSTTLGDHTADIASLDERLGAVEERLPQIGQNAEAIGELQAFKERFFDADGNFRFSDEERKSWLTENGYLAGEQLTDKVSAEMATFLEGKGIIDANGTYIDQVGDGAPLGLVLLLLAAVVLFVLYLFFRGRKTTVDQASIEANLPESVVNDEKLDERLQSFVTTEQLDEKLSERLEPLVTKADLQAIKSEIVDENGKTLHKIQGFLEEERERKAKGSSPREPLILPVLSGLEKFDVNGPLKVDKAGRQRTVTAVEKGTGREFKVSLTSVENKDKPGEFLWQPKGLPRWLKAGKPVGEIAPVAPERVRTVIEQAYHNHRLEGHQVGVTDKEEAAA